LHTTDNSIGHIFHFKKELMATIITALIILGTLGAIIGLLMFVHKRDQKADAVKKQSSS
jgi:hypothetical protein